MILVNFTLDGSKTDVHVGNVDAHIPGAEHLGGGRCVLKIRDIEGASLPPKMQEVAKITKVELKETGIEKPIPVGRHKQDGIQIEVTANGSRRNVNINGTSFSDVLLSYRELISGKITPKQLYPARS